MKSDSLWQSLWLCVCEGSNLVGEPSIFSIYCLPVDCGLQLFHNSLLLRQKPRVWGPWKRITTWNASSQLLKFSNLAKIGQIGRQRDKLMQNLLRLLTDGVDASSPNKSNVIKWRLYFKSNVMTNLSRCWKVLWLLSGAEAGCEGKGVLADQVQAFLLQVILKDGIMRMVNWIICSSRTRYSAKTEGGPDMGSWHADSFGLIFFEHIAPSYHIILPSFLRCYIRRPTARESWNVSVQWLILGCLHFLPVRVGRSYKFSPLLEISQRLTLVVLCRYKYFHFD